MRQAVPEVDPKASRPPELRELVDIPRLLTACYVECPDLGVAEERISLSTLGHRGSSDGPADAATRKALAALIPHSLRAGLTGETVAQVLTRAAGDDALIGGAKVVTAGGWFAARPSGTDNICKIYCESFRSAEHLGRIKEVRAFVAGVTAD